MSMSRGAAGIPAFRPGGGQLRQLPASLPPPRLPIDVAWQTERVAELLAELVADRVTVFVGVPTENHPWRPAETVAAGLRGVRKGLAEVDDERAARIGVAVFADWTTTDAEWAAYLRGWLAAG
jgi:hypothetical protein